MHVEEVLEDTEGHQHHSLQGLVDLALPVGVVRLQHRGLARHRAAHRALDLHQEWGNRVEPAEACVDAVVAVLLQVVIQLLDVQKLAALCERPWIHHQAGRRNAVHYHSDVLRILLDLLDLGVELVDGAVRGVDELCDAQAVPVQRAEPRGQGGLQGLQVGSQDRSLRGLHDGLGLVKEAQHALQVFHVAVVLLILQANVQRDGGHGVAQAVEVACLLDDLEQVGVEVDQHLGAPGGISVLAEDRSLEVLYGVLGDLLHPRVEQPCCIVFHLPGHVDVLLADLLPLGRGQNVFGLEAHDGLLDPLEEGLAPVDRPGHRGLVLRQWGLGHLRLEDLLNPLDLVQVTDKNAVRLLREQLRHVQRVRASTALQILEVLQEIKGSLCGAELPEAGVDEFLGNVVDVGDLGGEGLVDALPALLRALVKDVKRHRLDGLHQVFDVLHHSVDALRVLSHRFQLRAQDSMVVLQDARNLVELSTPVLHILRGVKQALLVELPPRVTVTPLDLVALLDVGVLPLAQHGAALEDLPLGIRGVLAEDGADVDVLRDLLRDGVGDLL
eukprot:RCo001400